MFELVQPLIASPVLPATILLGLVIAWSLFTIVVGYGLEMHGHLPFHLDDTLANHPVFHWFGDALGSVVLTPTKWLNLRSVPLMQGKRSRCAVGLAKDGGQKRKGQRISGRRWHKNVGSSPVRRNGKSVVQLVLAQKLVH